jgi:hypothetical protein
MKAFIEITGRPYEREGFQNLLAGFEIAKAAAIVGHMLFRDHHSSVDWQ